MANGGRRQGAGRPRNEDKGLPPAKYPDKRKEQVAEFRAELDAEIRRAAEQAKSLADLQAEGVDILAMTDEETRLKFCKAHTKLELIASIQNDMRKKFAGAMTPLEHMLGIMNDPRESIKRRDQMAINAAPYCHARMQPETGKPKPSAADAQPPWERDDSKTAMH